MYWSVTRYHHLFQKRLLLRRPKMFQGKSALLAFAVVVVCRTPTVFGDAATPNSNNNAYQTYYAVESGSSNSHYGAPAPTYGAPNPSPSPGYGNPPPASYGPPSETYDASHYQAYSLDDENPFIQQRLFNTAVALTIPLFSFQLPQRSAPAPGGVDLANQAIFAVFALFVVVLVFAVPVLFTKPPDFSGRSNDRDGILNHLMANNKVFNFMGADLTNKIGLDTTKCLQKSICEAHRTPKKYGIIATPFQMFFPPPTNGTSSDRSSIFQIAAKDGKYSKKSCGKKYNCFFDTLDLVSYLADWWKHAGDPNYVLEF